MTIKLKSGREIDDYPFVSAFSATPAAYQPVGTGNDENEELRLTPDERRELAHVMMARWAKWGGSAPAKLLVVEEGAPGMGFSACNSCPLLRYDGYSGETLRCNAVDDRRVIDDHQQAQPDWCPLRTGDVVVRMQKREAT